jgi:NADPH2:quinone reductase
MRAAVCRAYGPPEGLVVEEVPAPVAGAGEVSVQVQAAAVNFADVLMLGDRYQVSVPVPFTPGSDLAGEVVAVGDGVDGFMPGDRVFGAGLAGAFAEQAVVPAGALSQIPDGVDFTAAAALGVAHGTAYSTLRSVAEVKPGEWVVVLGAAGGVGLAVVELARALGGRVVAAASSAEKLALCREHGAEEVIDYSVEDLKLRIRELTGGAADVVVDMVGGARSEQALRSVRWGGRFVTVGYASGEIPRIPLNLVMLKGVVVKGFEIRNFVQHAPEAAARDRAELAELLADGRIRPHVGAVFPLSEVAAALRLVADRGALGKVVIDPSR